MSRLRISLLSLLAVFAFSAVADGVAQAAVKGGPIWITKAGELKAGETRNITSLAAVGAQILKSAAVTVECSSIGVKAGETNEIIGGNPGTDVATLVFDECHVAGKTTTTCSVHGPGAANTGEIVVKVKTLLGYKTAEAEPIYVQFFPASETNEFVTLEFAGTECGVLKGTKVVVKATGSEAPKPISFGKRVCGVIAEGSTKSGELVKVMTLKLPTTAITEEKVWNSETKAFVKVTCALTAAGGAATQSGTATIDLENEEEFGVEI